MRILITAALAVFAASVFAAGPASATWTCIGAEFVCGPKSVAGSPRKARSSYSASRRVGDTYKRHHGPKRRLAAGGDHRSAKAWSKRERRLARRAGSERRIARTPVRQYSGGGGGQTGIASYYWQGQRVASGGRFNPNAMTAAHRTLPFGTKVRVTHMGSGRSVDVTINDRGPFVRGRVIDLSRAAAGVIGMRGSGLARVKVAVIGRN